MARALHSIHVANSKREKLRTKSFLQFLAERKLIDEYPLISTFQNYFGHLSQQAENLTKTDIYFIFRTLNKFIFDYKLKKINIILDNKQNIFQYLKAENKENNMSDNDIKVNFVAMYNRLVLNTDEELLTIKNSEQLKIGNKVIFVVKEYIKNRSIIEVIDYITHELIHYYDEEFGQLKQCFIDYLKTGIQTDSHNTDTFNKYRNKANKYGLNITDTVYVNENNNNRSIILHGKNCYILIDYD